MPPLPDKLVVLTFDDGSISHLTVAGPLLKELGFGATFFVTEGLGVAAEATLPAEERTFMTWPEIKALEALGGEHGLFEIGNHTKNHQDTTGLSAEDLGAQMDLIDRRCQESGVQKTETFCFPGYHNSQQVVDVLRDRGFKFARRGGTEPNLEQADGVYAADAIGRPYSGPYPDWPLGSIGVPYDPALHDPLLVPTTIAGGPDMSWEDFVTATEEARGGKACVMTFHGTPDSNFDFVSTPAAMFERCMRYLHANEYQVIALRDLERFGVQPSVPDASSSSRI
jgi:peptidoglycan/xylan/chitin deacetylase (PgdA/CDA1 family)